MSIDGNPAFAAAARRRAMRQDGLATRAQVLEVAGRVFAQRGYAHTTSKEICARARTNAAAVNYHFGSKDGLYSAVLVEAHRRIVSVETLSALAATRLDARAKLEAIIARLASELSQRSSKSAWEFRVLSRELLSPTPMLSVMLAKEAAPKARILRSILAEIMQLPPEHPAVARSFISVLAPCLMLLIGHQAIRRKVLPDLDLEPQALTRHMVQYALAGLEAVAKEARGRP